MTNIEKKPTLVLGASPKPDRYSYLAVKRLLSHDQPVYALGNRETAIDETPIVTGTPDYDDVHTVTLYLNPKRQEQYYDYIIGLKPKRIIFNPGTENDELMNLAKENGIEILPACTLVMLSTDQF